MKIEKSKSSFLLGVSLVTIGSSLIILLPDTPFGLVFIGLGGVYMLITMRRKSRPDATSDSKDKAKPL